LTLIDLGKKSRERKNGKTGKNLYGSSSSLRAKAMEKNQKCRTINVIWGTFYTSEGTRAGGGKKLYIFQNSCKRKISSLLPLFFGK
jgi:hypothetical protein